MVPQRQSPLEGAGEHLLGVVGRGSVNREFSYTRGQRIKGAVPTLDLIAPLP